jgi:hypothetical protein
LFEKLSSCIDIRYLKVNVVESHNFFGCRAVPNDSLRHRCAARSFKPPVDP